MDNFSIEDYFGAATINHCVKIFQIAQQEGAPDLSVDVMTIKTQRLSSFMIIDRVTLVVVIDGYDPDGLTYMVGAFFFEDRNGKLIERFTRYFRNVERQANNIGLIAFQKAQTLLNNSTLKLDEK